MIKEIAGKRRLTPREAAKYRKIREKVTKELPDLIKRRHERMEASDPLARLCEQLRATRQKKGLSLADVMKLTGMDRAAISKLETGRRPNPTLDTLVRYAEAIGKHVKFQLVDA